MTSTDADYRPLPDDVNDADLAEQQASAAVDPDDFSPEPHLTELPDEVPEADAVEQAVSVPYDEDDYR